MVERQDIALYARIAILLSQSLAGKGGQDECCSVDVLVVVLAQLLLLFRGPASERLLEVGIGILGANHETDLTRWVGGNSGVGIVDSREDFLAVLLELGDEWQVQPLVLSYIMVSKDRNIGPNRV